MSDKIDKIFDLVEKVYSELQETEIELQETKKELKQGIQQTITLSGSKMNSRTNLEP